MTSPRSMLIGLGVCAAALLLALAEPRAALAGWLAGFVFWSALPIGALGLAMMMRLIPGGWGAELMPFAQAALWLLPLAAAAALPVLLGVHALYPWADAPAQSGFRAIYLNPWFFALRSVAAFAGFLLLAFLLLRRPWSTAVAAGGLILFALLDTTIAVDWLMSLEPDFHSSGFGLYVLSIQMTIALAMLMLRHLAADYPAGRLGILGGLLLTALLLWAYFAFMQYFIIWSGDLPHGVMWYQRRGAGSWGAVEYAIGALHLGPTVLLILPFVRRSRRWLLALAFAVLAGKAAECAWLVLPTVERQLTVGLAAAALSFGGLGTLSIAGLRTSRRLAADRQEASP